MAVERRLALEGKAFQMMKVTHIGGSAMDRIPPSRSTQEKVALFQRFFTGRTDAYGTYDLNSGRARQVKDPVTRQVLLDHLCGRQPYGVYLLVGNLTRAAAADFDHPDMNPAIEFLDAARQYSIPAYLERSKSKGYHAWIFFQPPGVFAWKARTMVRHLLSEIEQPDVEVFPKQDAVTPDAPFGNFIYAPLFGRLVPEGRTVFLDPGDPNRPAVDQWEVLAGIQSMTESALDEVIQLNGLHSAQPWDHGVPRRDSEGPGRAFGLPPCAQRMLSEGVTEHQRVSCFRLGVHLKRAGLPLDAAIAALTIWAQKNRPQPGKRVITPSEIADQTQSAYSRAYRACGCEEPCIARYCSPNCPLQRNVRARQDPGVQLNSDENAAPEQPEGTSL